MAHETCGKILEDLYASVKRNTGVKKEAFAGRIGWSYSTLRRLEKGEIEFTVDHLEALVHAVWIKRGDDWWTRFQEALAHPPRRNSRSGCAPIAIAVVIVVIGAIGLYIAASLMGVIGGEKGTGPVAGFDPGALVKSALSDSKVLFEDSFGDRMSSRWETQSGDWRIINGQLSTVSRDREWSRIFVGDTSWTDYTVEMECRVPNTVWSSIGIYARVKDPQNLVGFTTLAYSGSRAFMQVCLDGDCKELTRADFSADEFRQGVKVRLDVKGDMFTVYTADRRLMSVNEPALTSGKVGIVIYCGGSDCPYIKSFKVTRLD